jgi:hypothetical protein
MTSEMTNPPAPTIIKITPTAERLIPLTDALTAKYRIAPTAMRNMLIPLLMTYTFFPADPATVRGSDHCSARLGRPLGKPGRSSFAREPTRPCCVPASS